MNALGKWISNETARPFLARKELWIDKKITKAVAYVCGLGQFHFYLNGEKVGNHELDPGWTNYDKLVQYVAFDVKEQLRRGKNVMDVEVGNGWYHMMRERYYMSMPPKRPEFSFLPPNPNPYQPFSQYLALGFRMELLYEDGTGEEILSDESWLVRPHYVTMSNVYGSEIIDGRLRAEMMSGCGEPSEEQPEGKCGCGGADVAGTWQQAAVLAQKDCPKGRLVEQYQPPVTVKRTYEAKNICSINGRDIYDFSQNMSAILEFEVKGKRGDTVHIYPAEKLSPDGDVDQMAKGWTPIDVCITYIVGEDDVWEKCRMKFTYFAGRYIAVEGAVPAEDCRNGVPSEEDCRDGVSSEGDCRNGMSSETAESRPEAQIRGIHGDYITSSVSDTGSFTCDDKRLEQIYDLVLKAVESNLLSVHTDCPTIERYAWQEPNHLMAPSIMFMKDVSVLWDKILWDLRVDQCTGETCFNGLEGEKFYPGEGMVPSQAPCYEHNVLPAPMGSFFDIIPWGSTCILGPYWHYLYYGDKKILADNYETGMRYLSYLKSKVTEEGFINHGLGDWGTPDPEGFARENIETAFLYADAVTLAKAAIALGKYDDMVELEDYAREVKDRYNEKLLVKHPAEGFWCYRAWDHPDAIYLTQASQAMPLYWGLVPDDKRTDVEKAFAWVLDRDQTFVSGEVGLPYIIQTMNACGMQERIIDFILRKQHPSYYAFVLAGETTLGEYWEENPRSHNHDMMGHIVEWFYNGIGGIRPVKPGFAEMNICPYMPETTKEFVVKYCSVKGRIKIHVKEEDERILVETEVPAGIVVKYEDRYLRKQGKKVEWRRG